MRDRKSKEQLLNELIEMQKVIEEKVEVQDSLIKRFSILIQNERLFTRIIENFPYPIAIFKRSGAIVMANCALMERFGLTPNDVQASNIRFFNRIGNENKAVMEAVEKTFKGETTLLKDLVKPLSMFERANLVQDTCESYKSAVFFPVMSSSDLCYGAVMLMK